jgi:hypothetical protein
MADGRAGGDIRTQRGGSSRPNDPVPGRPLFANDAPSGRPRRCGDHTEPSRRNSHHRRSRQRNGVNFGRRSGGAAAIGDDTGALVPSRGGRAADGGEVLRRRAAQGRRRQAFGRGPSLAVATADVEAALPLPAAVASDRAAGNIPTALGSRHASAHGIAPAASEPQRRVVQGLGDGRTATDASQFIVAVVASRGARRRTGSSTTAERCNQLRPGLNPPLVSWRGLLRDGVGGGRHGGAGTHAAPRRRHHGGDGDGGIAPNGVGIGPREPRPGRSWQRPRATRPPAPPAAAGPLGERRIGAPDPRGIRPTTATSINRFRSNVRETKIATNVTDTSNATSDSGVPLGRATRLQPQPIA